MNLATVPQQQRESLMMS